MIVTQHHGQHNNCFACKLKSLTYSTGRPPQNNVANHWDNDPVVKRIEELNGITIDTDQLNKESHNLRSN